MSETMSYVPIEEIDSISDSSYEYNDDPEPIAEQSSVEKYEVNQLQREFGEKLENVLGQRDPAFIESSERYQSFTESDDPVLQTAGFFSVANELNARWEGAAEVVSSVDTNVVAESLGFSEEEKSSLDEDVDRFVGLHKKRVIAMEELDEFFHSKYRFIPKEDSDVNYEERLEELREIEREASSELEEAQFDLAFRINEKILKENYPPELKRRVINQLSSRGYLREQEKVLITETYKENEDNEVGEVIAKRVYNRLSDPSAYSGGLSLEVLDIVPMSELQKYEFFDAERLHTVLFSDPELNPQQFKKVVAETMYEGQDPEKVTEVWEDITSFLKNEATLPEDLRRQGVFQFGAEFKSIEGFTKVVENSEELLPIIKELVPYGFRYNPIIAHIEDGDEVLDAYVESLKEVGKNIEEVKAEMEAIRRINPGFKYEPSMEYVSDDTNEVEFETDPFELLVAESSILQKIAYIENAQMFDEQGMGRKISDSLMKQLRPEQITSLSDEGEVWPTEHMKENFYKGMIELSKKTQDENSLMQTHAQIFLSREVVRYFAENPQNIETISDLSKADLRFCRTLLDQQSGRFDNYIEIMNEARNEQESIPQNYTDALLERLRKRDGLLGKESDITQVPETTRKNFNIALEKQSKTLSDETSWVHEMKHIFVSPDVLTYISRQPEKIDTLINLPDYAPKLYELMKPGGPLASNKEIVIKDLLENGDFEYRTKVYEKVFTQKIPYWRQLFLYTDLRLGDKLATANSAYEISKLGSVEVSNLVERHKKAVEEGTTSRLEKVIDSKDILNQLENGERDTIPIVAMHGMYKKLAFRDHLKSVIELSRSKDAKESANLRNRNRASELELKVGNYVHGSAVDFVDEVLLNGNLPGEALGETSKSDSYPFHFDGLRIEDSHLESHPQTREALEFSLAGGHGKDGVLGEKGQIFYLYERNSNSYNADIEYSSNKGSHHALVWGGMPATEISGIVLANEETTLNRVKEAVLENGFYIPLYNKDGELLFSAEEYDSQREQLNLTVEVEVWDYSLKTGDKLGSNEGGVFQVPVEEGLQQYYVKFEKEEVEGAHIWTEQLADNIYKEMGINVPETKIVKVEGRYGHASSMLEAEHKSREETIQNRGWNEGFVVDAWLGNWDIPYGPDRNAIVDEEGNVLRLDNGGALLFHARGDRKSQELFSEEVKEINMGTNRERLGEGMRQEYPGITDEEIKVQINNLNTIMTDQKIDELVDGVRLSRQDRDFLKQRLKARRDYLVEYADNL